MNSITCSHASALCRCNRGTSLAISKTYMHTHNFEAGTHKPRLRPSTSIPVSRAFSYLPQCTSERQ